MSRVLASILGATEPAFRQQIDRLERAAGLPSADIRLMMQVINDTRDKVRMLGLDPHDTTGPELYRTLQQRLRDDEVRVRSALELTAKSTPTNMLEAVSAYLTKQTVLTHTFVVKQSVMRAVIKKLQPKATMKKLGYRSLDSMVKHEPLAQLLAAATMLESKDWQSRRYDAYKKLSATDFETKKASFYVPTTKQWPSVAKNYIDSHRHNLVSVPELGAIVMLPMDQDLDGLAITTLLLSMQSINDIRATSSYLKLQQVRPDFGKVFSDAMQKEPVTNADLTGEPLPWGVVQWFYGHGHSAYHPDAFQPHVQPEDLAWHDGEAVLAGLHGALDFWNGSQLLALLDGKDTVSLNLLDVALSVCNSVDYSQRIVEHMRTALSHELLARYLHQDNLHSMLLGSLDAQLAPEAAF